MSEMDFWIIRLSSTLGQKLTTNLGHFSRSWSSGCIISRQTIWWSAGAVVKSHLVNFLHWRILLHHFIILHSYEPSLYIPDFLTTLHQFSKCQPWYEIKTLSTTRLSKVLVYDGVQNSLGSQDWYQNNLNQLSESVI